MPFPTYETSQLPCHEDCHAFYATQLHAYALWEKAGRPEGMNGDVLWADHFWYMAEAQLRGELVEVP